MSNDSISREHTKKAILQITNKLFVKYGYHQVTFQAIADKAGLAKSSIFFHYKTKEKLACEAIQSLIKFVSFFTLLIEKDLRTKKANLIDTLTIVFTDHPELAAPIYLAIIDSTIIQEKVKNYFNSWLNFLKKIGSEDWAIMILYSLIGCLLLTNLNNDFSLMSSLLESSIFREL